MTGEALVQTYQTRPRLNSHEEGILTAYAALMSRVKRSLFAKMMAGKSPASLKAEFLKRFGITARQFNACRVEVEGKIESTKEVNKQRIADLEIALEKQLGKIKKLKGIKLFLARQRLNRLRHKLERLKQDSQAGVVRICFGGRRLFQKQHEAEHAEWKGEWREARDHSFFTLGSKDETAGNQTCTAKEENGRLLLRLRLPDALGQGKYLEIPSLYFAYGQERLITALNQKRAISYRFLKDPKGWRIFATTTSEKPEWVSDIRLGVIGIDINADHLAVTETDRFGNPISTERIPLVTYGKTTAQSLALIGNAAAHIVRHATQCKKPLILEKLDFQQKKRALSSRETPSYKRMLSSFSYNRILQTIHSRAYRHGIEVRQVNPAYTSLIGRIKFAKRYGITTHQAAALCIGRRVLGLTERLPRQSYVSDNRGHHFLFSVPVRKRETQIWTHFRQVARQLQVALVEHFRVMLHQSSDPPDLCDPSRELLAQFQYANR